MAYSNYSNQKRNNDQSTKYRNGRDRYNNRLSHAFMDGSSVPIRKTPNGFEAMWNGLLYSADNIKDLRSELRIAEITRSDKLEFKDALAIRWEITNYSSDDQINYNQYISVKKVKIAQLTDGRYVMETSYRRHIQSKAYYVSIRNNENNGHYTLRSVIPYDKNIEEKIFGFSKENINTSVRNLSEFASQLNDVNV